ncbi:DMT family transporter [Variovorax defluvii]|uniref:DMT family transporter n=1 Tax=Variovorax defluvii TaxID=913761 RepID=A0ABP8IGF6_9BURK
MPHPLPGAGVRWMLLLAAGLALGAALPLGKLAAADGVGPVAFVLLSVVASGLLLALLGWCRHGLPARPWRLALFGTVSGLLGLAAPNTLAAWLSSEAGASFAALAYTLPPLLTLAGGMAAGLEPPRWSRVASVGLGLAGALWLAWAHMEAGAVSLGAILALMGIPAAIAAGNLYRACFLPSGVPAEWLGAAMALGASVLLLPVWSWSPPSMAGLDAGGLPWVGLQVLAAAAGAIAFFELQRRASAVVMSFLGYVVALAGVVFGALLLDESLPWQLAPATALIVAGFWLVQRKP